jgi:hypothetical protein
MTHHFPLPTLIAQIRRLLFFRISIKQGMPAIVHKSHEGNHDLQIKSAMNKERDFLGCGQILLPLPL